ncbi:MAG: OST-HTH/LOTUS domain-containing protein, partial [Bacteroidota bacterium]
IELNALLDALLVIDPHFSFKEMGFKSFKKFIKNWIGDVIEKIEKRQKEWTIYFKPKEKIKGFSQPKQLRRKIAAPKPKNPRRISKQQPPALRNGANSPSKEGSKNSNQPSSPKPSKSKKVGKESLAEARSLVKRYLGARKKSGPVPLARFKPHLLAIDKNFSEKKLGFSVFKQFVLSLEGDLVDRIQKDENTWMVYFKSENHPKASQPDERQKDPASPKKHTSKPNKQEATEKTHQSTKKSPAHQGNAKEKHALPASSQAEENTLSKLKVQAKTFLDTQLHYSPNMEKRLQVGENLLHAFKEYPLMTRKQVDQQLIRRTKDPSFSRFIKIYVDQLLRVAAIEPSNADDPVSSRFIRLSETYQEADALDEAYIAGLSESLKEQFPELKAKEILSLLF